MSDNKVIEVMKDMVKGIFLIGATAAYIVMWATIGIAFAHAEALRTGIPSPIASIFFLVGVVTGMFFLMFMIKIMEKCGI